MTENQPNETSAEALARSGFGFALFALIPAIITWVWLWLSTPSPDPTFRLIRWGIIIGFGGLLLFLLWITRYFYVTSAEKLHKPAQAIVRFFSNSIMLVLSVLILLEVNIIAFLILRGIAPPIINPLKFLMVCWSILLMGIIITASRDLLKAWYSNSRGIWVSIGIGVMSSVLVGGLVMVTSWVVNQTGVNDQLRGSLDYRPLIFYDDGDSAPSASEFWTEQSQTTVRWSPYTYWVLAEFDGEFINVGSDGIRYTPDYGGEQEIFVFGGSTVWGEGARDAYTIPGHLARLLNEWNQPQQVINYGQTGYVSSQDLIWFQRQLLRGNIPDIAIFYQGFNDTLSSWASGYVGITLQEDARLNDSEAGRRLRDGQPVLRLPNQTLSDYDMSSAGVISATPETIADLWFANVEVTQAIADMYEIEVLFVWQPAIIFKDILSESEQAIYERSDNERTGLFALYRDVDVIVRQRIVDGDYDNIIILSDLFADDSETIFHDLVHITEVGNAYVAEALMPYLVPLFEE